MKNTRIAVIGIGNMGLTYAKGLSEGKVPGMELVAVCDMNPERLKLLPEVKGFTDPIELMDSGLIDAVAIVTPHYDHVTLGVAALSRGIHTLVDKPIAVHKADAEKLLAAHTDPKVVFSAMFNQRTDPRYQKLKDLIESGELGAIRRINWIITDWYRTESYYASGGWRATWAGEGGGVLLNQCPHQLDLMQWLFGLPKKVRAFCQLGQFHDIEVEDNVTAYLEYESGATGVFITTTGEAPGTNRLEVACDRGKVLIEGEGIRWVRTETPVSEHLTTATGGFDKPDCWDISIATKGNGEQHFGILKNFAGAIRDGETLLAPAAEGIRSVELGNAMLYSSALEATVELPIDSKAYAELVEERIKNSKFVKKTVKDTGPVDLSGSFSH